MIHVVMEIASAFLVLEARLVLLVLLHTVVAADHLAEEIVGFVGDVAVMTAFALAFLSGTRGWAHGRDVPESA